MSKQATHSDRIVLTISHDPVANLKGSPFRLLAHLRSLAGHARRFCTFTKSLATALGACTNTIRAWRAALVEAGYIHFHTDKGTGITTIYIRLAVEPPSRRVTLEMTAGGAQFSAPIKPSKKIPYPFQYLAACARKARLLEKEESARHLAAWKPKPQPIDPIRTVAEQIAMLEGRLPFPSG